jgi:hypothetical protein
VSSDKDTNIIVRITTTAAAFRKLYGCYPRNLYVGNGEMGALSRIFGGMPTELMSMTIHKCPDHRALLVCSLE